MSKEVQGGLEPGEEFLSVEEEEAGEIQDEGDGNHAPQQEEEKVNWEEPSEEQVEGEEGLEEAGVQIGLGQFGPVIIVRQHDGTVAQKTLSVEECFILAGQLTGFASFIMGMSMQQQMAEQARLQAMMAQGGPGNRSQGGVHLP